MDRKRSLEMDIMKIIACLSVIIIHVTGTPAAKLQTGSLGKLIAIFANAITLYAVPCFILVSGIVLMMGYKNKKIEYPSFLAKRCNAIVVPYLIWCAIFYSTYVIMGIRELSVENVLIAFVLGKANYHLYFVPIILQMYMLFPLMKNLIRNSDSKLVIGAATVIHIFYSQFIPTFQFKDRFFMSYLIFFIIGMVIGKDIGAFKSLLNRYRPVFIGIYLISFTTWFAGKYYFYEFGTGKLLGTFQIWYVFSIFSTIALFMLSSSISSSLSHEGAKRALTLSAATFYVYLSHPYVLLILKRAYQLLGISNLNIIMAVSLTVTTIICFYLSIAYLRIKRRVSAP